jgi:hypothetical protein
MNQHQAGTAANPPGTGLEYRDPALSRPLSERAGWTDADAARESIHDAEHGARPEGRPATFAPGSGGTADRPA